MLYLKDNKFKFVRYCSLVPLFVGPTRVYLLDFVCSGIRFYLLLSPYLCFFSLLLSDFINLTQVHNFTVSAQDIFTFRRLSVFTVSFTGILQLLMQIMKRFVPSF